MSTKTTISTQLFRILTPCDARTVWQTLTPKGDRASFYGAALVSDWQVGSSVELRARVGTSVVGEVLATEPGASLSHTLGDQLDEPSVYVTWTIHPADGGTLVRLYVDELGATDGAEDTELAWLPVLGALRDELDRCMR
jgi:hypothetical protein